MYDSSRCRDWGLQCDTGDAHVANEFESKRYAPDLKGQTAALLSAVEQVERFLREDATGFDGIGGVCEGGLVAALIATRLPLSSSVRFYLNICSMPWTLLPQSLLAAAPVSGSRRIRIPSLHLLATHDELVDAAGQRSIPDLCDDAHVLHVTGGHVIPLCTPALKAALSSLVGGATGRRGRVDHTIDILDAGVAGGSKGQSGDCEEGEWEAGEDDPLSDPLSRVLSSARGRLSPMDHMSNYLYALAMFLLVQHHLSSCRTGVEVDSDTGSVCSDIPATAAADIMGKLVGYSPNPPRSRSDPTHTIPPGGLASDPTPTPLRSHSYHPTRWAGFRSHFSFFCPGGRIAAPCQPIGQRRAGRYS